MTIITLKDMRKAKICPDARMWCASHNIDWRGFRRHGIHVDTLRATGDNLSAINRLEQAALLRVATERKEQTDGRH